MTIYRILAFLSPLSLITPVHAEEAIPSGTLLTFRDDIGLKKKELRGPGPATGKQVWRSAVFQNGKVLARVSGVDQNPYAILRHLTHGATYCSFLLFTAPAKRVDAGETYEIGEKPLYLHFDEKNPGDREAFQKYSTVLGGGDYYYTLLPLKRADRTPGKVGTADRGAELSCLSKRPLDLDALRKTLGKEVAIEIPSPISARSPNVPSQPAGAR